MTYITIAGALFLGLVAVLPSIAVAHRNYDLILAARTSHVVSVVLETAKQMQSQVVAQNYEKFI